MHGSQEYIVCATFCEYRTLDSETSLELFVMCGAGVACHRTVLMEMATTSMQAFLSLSLRSPILLATTAGTLVKNLQPTCHTRDIRFSWAVCITFLSMHTRHTCLQSHYHISVTRVACSLTARENRRLRYLCGLSNINCLASLSSTDTGRFLTYACLSLPSSVFLRSNPTS